ncbi:MAG: DUF2791 family P-loop domain-containing protein [Acidobacteria bacterium]|nr:DUF2791 family P-loop domain-containing protein [Acidobacteriota bacterium]
MIASIQPSEWLRHMEREYLRSYVREGGSAIKFAVPIEEDLRDGLIGGVVSAGARNAYPVAKVSAAETKVHMVEELFFRIAEQIPWAALCRNVIAKIAVEIGYSWVEPSGGPLYRRLAEANGVDPQMLQLELKQAIWKKVLKQGNLSKDFRTAMTHMCVAELSGGADGAMTMQILTEWLTGRNRAVSAVKPFQIFRKITRASGRHFHESLVNWVRLAGCPGLVIVLDAERLTVARNPHDNGLFYSKAAVLDAYEVLREFIDNAGRLSGCFIVVVPGGAFLDDGQGRGGAAYEALKFRVFDEVRDKYLVNPMAALARISTLARGA